MIKLTVNKDNINIHEISGNGVDIMSELCVIVEAVCTAFTENEKDSEKMCSEMVLVVANTLKVGEETKWGADFEDDENADF